MFTSRHANKSQRKMLITDGNIPNKSTMNNYQYIWIFNGLHLSELRIESIQEFIALKLKSKSISEVDIFVGFKDILRQSCNPITNYKSNVDAKLQSVDVRELYLDFRECGVELHFLNFEISSILNAFTHYFDIWGYKRSRAVLKPEYLLDQTNSYSTKIAKVRPLSHSLEYKLEINYS